MRRFLGLAVLSCLVLVGCSSTGREPIASGTTLTTQIANLERTQQQMRKQYDALGETLTRLETRIAALKGQQDRNVATLPQPASTAPAPQAAPERTTVTTTVTTTETSGQKPTGPTTLVGDLTDQDMAVQAVPAAAITPAAAAPEAPAAQTEAAKPAPARAAAGGRPQTYLMHLASYLDSAPVKPGWRQLSEKNASALAGLKPYVTPYNDNQDRRWLRLSAGPFNTSSEAHKGCEAVKAAGGWCDVLQVATSSMRELR